jgi:hypothetical protein
MYGTRRAVPEPGARRGACGAANAGCFTPLSLRYTAGMDTELAGWGEMGQRAGELAVFGDPLWADKVLRAAAR